MLAEYRMTLPAQTLESTRDAAARAVLAEAQAKLGFIPNMYAFHSLIIIK